jgi:hypothetical protein
MSPIKFEGEKLTFSLLDSIPLIGSFLGAENCSSEI